MDLCERLAADYVGDWWFEGYRGWSLTESGAREEGLRHTEHALALRPRNANAAHAMAHARFDRGETDEGRRFLDAFLPAYPINAALNGHLAWHQSLFALEQDDLPAALALYDARLRPAISTAPPLNTMTDAVSLLWRIRMQADAPSLPWEDVAHYAGTRFAQPGLPFADIHMAMVEALSGRGDALAQRIEALDALLASGRLPAGPVVPAMCRGIAAFAEDRYEDAAAILVPILPDVVRIGGSGAQRDMILDTAIAACLRAGQDEAARGILRRRLQERSIFGGRQNAMPGQ